MRPPPLSRRLAFGLIVAAALLVVACVWLLTRKPKEEAVAETRPTNAVVPPVAGGEIGLFFPGPRGLLVRETRALEQPEADGTSPSERAAQAVRELLAGPRNEGLQPALPLGTTLRAVHPGFDGSLFIDLDPAKDGARPAVGSFEELLMVYALVDTVALNVPEVKSVGLLWAGMQRTSFAGHVDTTRPLKARFDGIVDTDPGKGE